MTKLKVIYDTDPGVDDAMALLLLARHPRVELLAVTSVFGNATIETTTRNALFLKQRFGLSAPVARGAAGPLAGNASEPPTFVHGHNGIGDIPLPAITASADLRPAAQIIVDLVRANPREVTIIAVGRMTNLALAMRLDPGIVTLVRKVVVMGGAFGRNGHTGNVTPVAEANIWGDATAGDVVFGAGWPLAIAGLDVTHETVMSDTYLRDLASQSDEDGRFLWEVSRYYENFYRSNGITDGGFPVHDSSAVAYALHPEFFQTERGAVRVVTESIAVGQTILKPDMRFDNATEWLGRPSVDVCIDVDAPSFLDFYRDTILGKAR